MLRPACAMSWSGDSLFFAVGAPFQGRLIE